MRSKKISGKMASLLVRVSREPAWNEEGKNLQEGAAFPGISLIKTIFASVEKNVGLIYLEIKIETGLVYH